MKIKVKNRGQTQYVNNNNNNNMHLLWRDSRTSVQYVEERKITHTHTHTQYRTQFKQSAHNLTSQYNPIYASPSTIPMLPSRYTNVAWCGT